MIRNLYRTYLYIVCIALLIVVSVAVAGLLNVLLSQTALRGQFGEPPDRSQVVQAVTFAIVAFIVAGLIGGLHYWLLRRDLAADPHAGGEGVRAFFLNISAAISALIAIGAFASGLSQLGLTDINAASSFSGALASAVFYAVVECERRRARATTGAALAFQRLHLYGVPFVIVLIAITYWSNAIGVSADAFFSQLGLVSSCNDIFVPHCFYNDISLRNIIARWAAVILLGAAWGVYVWLTRGDGRSATRQVFHLAGIAVGLIAAIVGAQRGLDAVLSAILGINFNWYDFAGGNSGFIGPFTFGLLIFAAYFILYRREAAELPTGAVVGMLTLRAIAGLIFAVPFWVGCGLVLQHIVYSIVLTSPQPGPEHLANALALLISGIGYPPLALTLARESASPETAGPRRGFVLALLAGGTITGVVGLVIALRAYITSALGAPIYDWPHTAADGVVILVIGGIIAGLYGWLGAREHVFTPTSSQAPAAQAPAESASVESVLDALLAGKLSRDEAAAQIRQITR